MAWSRCVRRPTHRRGIDSPSAVAPPSRRPAPSQGGSYECALVAGGEHFVNGPERIPSEPAHHKLLDLVGDLALLGSGGNGGVPQGHIVAFKVRPTGIGTLLACLRAPRPRLSHAPRRRAMRFTPASPESLRRLRRPGVAAQRWSRQHSWRRSLGRLGRRSGHPRRGTCMRGMPSCSSRCGAGHQTDWLERRLWREERRR